MGNKQHIGDIYGDNLAIDWLRDKFGLSNGESYRIKRKHHVLLSSRRAE